MHALVQNFAQTYYYTTNTTTTTGTASTAALVIIFGIVLLFILFFAVCGWRLFTKAGKPGWAILVPIYGTLVQLQIIRRPWWWLLLFFVPLVGYIFGIIATFDLAKAYGKGIGFGFVLLFFSFIGIPILAFGSATYQPERLGR